MSRIEQALLNLFVGPGGRLLVVGFGGRAALMVVRQHEHEQDEEPVEAVFQAYIKNPKGIVLWSSSALLAPRLGAKRVVR